MCLLSRRALAACLAAAVAGVCWPASHAFAAVQNIGSPADLLCENMRTPLGLDALQPRFSWQLRDTRYGAKQSAYEIEIATSGDALVGHHADVWDSGRIASAQSVDVPYAGPALKPETRYFWRVRVWDKDGKPYPVSDVSWWETGLMADTWRAKWIGYELPEDRAVRQANAVWISNEDVADFHAAAATRHDFRWRFSLESVPVEAHLYVTGKDVTSAWMNGERVKTAGAPVPWHQTPWQRYSMVDVTSRMERGENLLAIEADLFNTDGNNEKYDASQAAMNATLYLRMSDGTVRVVTSGTGWKAMLNAPDGWYEPSFADAAWPNAVRYVADDLQLVHPWPLGPVKMLRKAFGVEKNVRSARLYATALGAYEFWINGQRVGDQFLAPGWTDYRERVTYQTYDVTSLLQRGNNAVGALLAPGWYATPLQWKQQPYNYGTTPPALRAQLRMEYEDGSIVWVSTDASWQGAVSGISEAEIYDGEEEDARRAQPGWASAGFDSTQWNNVHVLEPAEPVIVAQDFQPIRLEKTLTAQNVTEPSPGVYIFDFGQNMTGVEHLQMSAAAGTTVQLRFGEVLNSDGTLYVENLRTAKATDHYTFSGHGVEVFEPQFTYHGFRYAELTGLSVRPGNGVLTAKVYHTDAPFTLTLETGNNMLNKLWQNIVWGQRSNMLSVPTDCPQRDERLGWSADAQVFWRTASYNMDLAQFSKKFARDLRGTQSGTTMYGIFAPGTSSSSPGYGAAWSDAGVIIPWTSWLQSGDTQVIEQNWRAMTNYLDGIADANPDFLWHNSGIAFGDWLSPEGKTSELLIATAYWAYDVTLMQQMAHATGRTQDEQKYAALFEKIRAAYQQAFVRPDGFVAGADLGGSSFGRVNNPDAVARNGDTQTGYVLTLQMRLVPEGLRTSIADHLAARIEANGERLGTGFLGTPYLLAVLADNGHADLAYRLLLSTKFPSWGYLVEHGATTMWERWNGDAMRSDPSMNSYNHYAYGAVGEWMFRYAAGVDATPVDAGFHTVYLHPLFSTLLGSADLTYDSPYGTIRSSWRVAGAHVRWDVTLPPNTVGLLSEQDSMRLLQNGKPLNESIDGHARPLPNGAEGFEIPAGSYEFTTSMVN